MGRQQIVLLGLTVHSENGTSIRTLQHHTSHKSLFITHRTPHTSSHTITHIITHLPVHEQACLVTRGEHVAQARDELWGVAGGGARQS